jgi:hypothetical protein
MVEQATNRRNKHALNSASATLSTGVLKQQELNMSSKSPRPPVGGDQGEGADQAAPGEHKAGIDRGQAGNGDEPVFDFHSPDDTDEELDEEILARRAAFRQLVEEGRLVWNGQVLRDRHGRLCKTYVLRELLN